MVGYGIGRRQWLPPLRFLDLLRTPFLHLPNDNFLHTYTPHEIWRIDWPLINDSSFLSIAQKWRLQSSEVSTAKQQQRISFLCLPNQFRGIGRNFVDIASETFRAQVWIYLIAVASSNWEQLRLISWLSVNIMFHLSPIILLSVPRPGDCRRGIALIGRSGCRNRALWVPQ
jgi:hypothetical protein